MRSEESAVPIYEYTCQECGTVSDFLVQKIGAVPDDLRCAQCGSEKMTKALSTIAVHSAQNAGPACMSGECPLPEAARTGCCGPDCQL